MVEEEEEKKWTEEKEQWSEEEEVKEKWQREEGVDGPGNENCLKEEKRRGWGGVDGAGEGEVVGGGEGKWREDEEEKE